MNKSITISIIFAALLIGVAFYAPFGGSSALGAGAVCGNDIVEPGEACDGGANCTTGCTLKTPAPACGNDIVEAGEQCDGSSDCTTGCTLKPSGAVCGNDIVEAGEQCDGSSDCTTGCTLVVPPPTGCTSNCGGGGGGGGSFNPRPRLTLAQSGPVPSVLSGSVAVAHAILKNVGQLTAADVQYTMSLPAGFSFQSLTTVVTNSTSTRTIFGHDFSLVSGSIITMPRLWKLGDQLSDENRDLYTTLVVAPGTPTGTYTIPVTAHLSNSGFFPSEVKGELKVIVGNPVVTYTPPQYTPPVTKKPTPKSTQKPVVVVAKPAPEVCISAEEYARLTATSTFALASSTNSTNSGLLAAVGGLFDLGTGSTCFGLIILLLIILALVIIARLLYHYFEGEGENGEGDGQMPLIQE